MRFVVNALSTNNISGKYVLAGILETLAKGAPSGAKITVLHHESNKDIQADYFGVVHWHQCPKATTHWAARLAWEHAVMPWVLQRLQASCLINMSGAFVPVGRIPQVVVGQNPWPFLTKTHRGGLEKLKGALLRYGYSRAVKKADLLYYISEYLRDLYHNNAGTREGASEIAYLGLSEELYAKSRQLNNEILRKPYQIVSVSVMAPHKAIENVIQALHVLRSTYSIPANLVIVGPWPDKGYRNSIENLIEKLGLIEAVEIVGRVDHDQLYKYYASSKVFCLMSRSESFGIPGPEAQVFGTPVVCANGCAVPEVCGEGGLYTGSEDITGTARYLAVLLEDEDKWKRYSMLARKNTERFHWGTCGKPLLKVYELFSGPDQHSVGLDEARSQTTGIRQ